MDLKGLPGRKVSKASREDLVVLGHLVLKVNRVSLWQRKVYLDPEDRMANLDFLDRQDLLVNLVNLVSLAHLG